MAPRQKGKRVTEHPLKPRDRSLPDDLFNRWHLSAEQNAATYRELIEMTTHWFWEADENLACRYISPKVYDSLGYRPDELTGNRSLDRKFRTPEELDRITQVLLPVLQDHEPFAFFENRAIHKDGHEVILETSGVPVFDSNGTFMGYRGIDRDITEQKLLEQELREKRDSLEEANTALRVLLDYRAEFATEAEQRFGAAIRNLILPYIARLRKSTGSVQTTLLSIVERNLADLLDPNTLAKDTTPRHLTAAEIRIANLVRNGISTGEIAAVLAISPRTVEVHRRNIRKKLNLGKTNLRSYLLTRPPL